MTKISMALVTAAILALVAIGGSSEADAQWGRRGGAVAAGVIGGVALGAMIGSTMAPGGYYAAEPEPVYVEPRRGPCVAPQEVWSERRQRWEVRNVRVPC